MVLTGLNLERSSAPGQVTARHSSYPSVHLQIRQLLQALLLLDGLWGEHWAGHMFVMTSRNITLQSCCGHLSNNQIKLEDKSQSHCCTTSIHRSFSLYDLFLKSEQTKTNRYSSKDVSNRKFARMKSWVSGWWWWWWWWVGELKDVSVFLLSPDAGVFLCFLDGSAVTAGSQFIWPAE